MRKEVETLRAITIAALKKDEQVLTQYKNVVKTSKGHANVGQTSYRTTGTLRGDTIALLKLEGYHVVVDFEHWTIISWE